MSEYLFYISIIFLCLYVSIQLLNVLALALVKPNTSEKILHEDELPNISILLAARNEEKNILRCLNSLHELNYPKQKIEILIGDDHSEDNTKNLIEQFIANNHQFKLFSITTQLGKARGKANVLAQLAHQANGKYFLITDADIRVQPNWARELVSYFNEKVGIVSAATIVESDKTFMSNMQSIDWTYFMGQLRSFDFYGLKCTSAGNNMAVSAAAYWQTGGYENLDFSVTEDYKLYKEIRARDWDAPYIFNNSIINYSRPVDTFKTLINQRKRWLVGGKELPFYWWIIFSIFGLFFPAIIVLCFFNIKLALLFYALKWSLQSMSIFLTQHKLKLKKDFSCLFSYEFYNIVVSLSTQTNFFLPTKVIWKNREYNV